MKSVTLQMAMKLSENSCKFGDSTMFTYRRRSFNGISSTHINGFTWRLQPILDFVNLKNWRISFFTLEFKYLILQMLLSKIKVKKMVPFLVWLYLICFQFISITWYSMSNIQIILVFFCHQFSLLKRCFNL